MTVSRHTVLTIVTFCAPFGLALRADEQVFVTRGPYLQTGTPTSIVLRWRTDWPSDSRVVYGTSLGHLADQVSSQSPTKEHEIQLSNLLPDTKYYYAVGSGTAILAGDDPRYFFVTAPGPGTEKPVRVWILGDSGTADPNAVAVRNAYFQRIGNNYTDLCLMLGDNAYPAGSDTAYQKAVFEMYPSLLRQTVLWPTIGNHDLFRADSTTQSGPYFNIFTLPRLGEAGGVASGTEAFYSFDYTNIHFICLDSYGSDRSPGAAMLTWLENDLAATTQKWIIAYWHHPPYSKGSHDSDTDRRLVEMREYTLPLLETYGVDLVLTGHSHSYERSFQLHGHYGPSDTLRLDMIVNGSDGRSSGPYLSSALGTVYVVLGSSGKLSMGPLDHPVMYTSLMELGSMILEIQGDRLDARFIDDNGSVKDHLAIFKDAAAQAKPGPIRYVGKEQVSAAETAGPQTIEVRVTNGSDDAEESASGRTNLNSSDLELVYDGGNQTTGLRFQALDIPPRARIQVAYIQFKADEKSSSSALLTIAGEDQDSAPTFSAGYQDISSRARTTASVSWSPEAWASVGQAGPDQRTPNIAPVIQELVNRSGWSSGSSLVIIITGTGKRTAVSYDGNEAGAPVLHVEYTSP